MNKATKAEVNERVMQVYALLIKSATYNDIVRYCKEKYQICSSQSDKYIKKATALIQKNNMDALESMRALSTTKYMKWITMLEKDGNIVEASKLQARIDKINGLESTNVNVSGNIELSGEVKFSVIGVKAENKEV